MNNKDFLNAIENSFKAFIASGTSRSTKKLVPLHGAIAKDLHERLGDGYGIQSQGFASGKEGTIEGRYLDKKVDITITRGGKAVGGIAIKFVMQNYEQNATNYFENMLGETANIRVKGCPYFQIFIIPDKLPHYTQKDVIGRWETFGVKHMQKYKILDTDDPSVSIHSPDKMLLYVIHLPDIGTVANKAEYLGRYAGLFSKRSAGCLVSTVDTSGFARSVIVNDYEVFAEKVYHTILAL